MNTIVHRSEDRGSADYGWLKPTYYFSFSQYYDPDKMGFGLLRVLNDDRVASHSGFETHPHKNMEIITIPLEGSITHQDSMGSRETLSVGEVQVMTAGKGVYHSEHNLSDEELKLFQIWIFPRENDLEPAYAQKRFEPAGRNNRLQLIASPEKNGESLFINQDAWLNRIDFTEDKTLEYKLNKSGNGVYLVVIEGEISVGGEQLYTRDAIGITDTDSFTVDAIKNTSLLFIEVPMQ